MGLFLLNSESLSRLFSSRFLWLSLSFLSLDSFANPPPRCYADLKILIQQMEIVRYSRNELLFKLSGNPRNAPYPWAGDPEKEKLFRQFEDEYLALIESGDPSLLGTQFQSKWNLTDSQFSDIITYYSVAIWEDPTLSAFAPSVRKNWVKRLRYLKYAHSIKHSTMSPNVPRSFSKIFNKDLSQPLDYFVYFHKFLTQLSVPQMAEDLNLTESDVYKLLSDLQVSIDKKWSQTKFIDLFNQLNKLKGTGTEITDSHIKDLAQNFKVGPEALKFYLHFVGSYQNGKTWNFEETTRLKNLRLKNRLSISEIAQALGRTEASVQAKLSNLGLVSPLNRGADLIVQPPYGALKENGQLQREALVDFILGTGLSDRNFLIDILEVDASSFDAFIARHHLDFLLENSLVSKQAIAEGAQDSAASSQARRSLARAQRQYADQRDFLDSIVSDIKTQAQAFSGNQKIDPVEILKNHRVEIEKYFGENNSLQFFEALLKILEKQNLGHTVDLWKLSLNELNLLPKSQLAQAELDLRNLQKKYTLINVINFLKNNPTGDLTWSAGGPHTPFENKGIALKVMGSGDYRPAREGLPAGISSHIRVFDGPENFWLEIYKAAKKSDIPFDLTSVRLSNFTPEFRETLKSLWLEKILNFLKNNPTNSLEWSEGGTQTPFEHSGIANKVMGSGAYRPAREGELDGRGSHNRVFDGPEIFWLEVYKAAKKNDIPFDLTSVQFSVITPTLRETLKSLWLEKILNFLKNNPTNSLEWSAGGPHTPFENDGIAKKVMGSGLYRPAREGESAGRGSHHRVFESTENFWMEIYIAAKKSDIPFDLTLVQFSNVTPGLREILKSLWLEKILNFLKNNSTNRLEWSRGGPQTPFENGGIPQKVMGSGVYRPAREGLPAGISSHNRVFDGPENFWLEIYKAAKTRDIHFDLTKVRFSNLTSEMRETLKSLWLEKILNFLKNNPTNRLEWSQGGTQTPFESAAQTKKVMGSGAYRAASEDKTAGNKTNQRIFDSSDDFWKALRDAVSTDPSFETTTKERLVLEFNKKIESRTE